ncbi:hypothetical protein AAHC03_0795 [Spirometra sp. Aus1]
MFPSAFSCPTVVLVHGSQKVAKFNQVEEDLVRITFALYRFTDNQADVLVCHNDPSQPSFENGSTNLGDISQSSPAGINETCLLSLRLLDPSIFG